ncbi:WD40 repeat domain-containing protein [Nocardia sp. NBC_01499]|uniref:WD40 repeat domain-containing protein n=1 Tax=Nocardia sp. NBC_01499 TaxID=2903597 RepID=UPI0038637C96
MTATFTEVWRTPPTDAPNETVRAVAYAEINARPAAISIAGTTLAACDLASGEQFGRTHIPDTQDTLVLLTIADLDGTPIAVTSDIGGRVQALDLTSGKPLEQPVAELYGRTKALVAAKDLLLIGRGAGATSSVYEVPVASGSVEVWDIATRQCERWLRHGGYTDSIAVTEHRGRTVVVTGSTYAERPLLDPDDSESHLTAWDIQTGESLGTPIILPYNASAASMATGVLDERLLAVVVGDEGLSVWDLTEQRETTTVTCPGRIETITWAQTTTGPIVLAGGGELRADGQNWLRMWDPRDWRLIAETSTGSGSIRNCAAAPDGSVIVPWGDHVQLLRPQETR